MATVAGDTRSCVSLDDASVAARAFTFDLRDCSWRGMALPRSNAQWCCDRINRSLFECRPAESVLEGAIGGPLIANLRENLHGAALIARGT